MRGPTLPMAWWCATALLACTGRVPGAPGDGASMTGARAAGAGGAANPEPGGAAGASLAGGGGTSSRIAARRLNADELRGAVGALFGVTPRAPLPADVRSGRFDRDAHYFDVDGGVVRGYLELAVEVARAVDPVRMTGCAGGISRACVEAFLSRQLSVWLRRPTTAEDLATYLETYDRGVRRAGAAEGVREVVARAVMSPDFLYVLEPPATGAETALPPHALATRLALALWRQPPDAALFDEALAGASPVALAGRVLADPRARAGVQAFHAQWLDLDAAREADQRAGAPPGIGAAFAGSLAAWLDHAFSRDLSLGELLAGQGLFIDAPIRALLGLPGGSGPMVARRAGILLHPGFLAGRAHAQESAPILRGAFVAQRIACVPLVEPDIDLSALVPDASLPTTRARAEALTSPPACAGCHAIINPLGFAFEGFDQLGRPRTMDGGQPVDTSGRFTGLPVTGAFRDAEDMLDQLLPAPEVARCFARAWLEYLLARPLDVEGVPADAELVRGATEGLDAQAGVRAYLAGLLASRPVAWQPVGCSSHTGGCP